MHFINKVLQLPRPLSQQPTNRTCQRCLWHHVRRVRLPCLLFYAPYNYICAYICIYQCMVLCVCLCACVRAAYADWSLNGNRQLCKVLYTFKLRFVKQNFSRKLFLCLPIKKSLKIEQREKEEGGREGGETCRISVFTNTNTHGNN